jgi:hypothetical protein
LTEFFFYVLIQRSSLYFRRRFSMALTFLELLDGSHENERSDRKLAAAAAEAKDLAGAMIEDIASQAETPEEIKAANALRRFHSTGEYDPRQWAFLEKCREAEERAGVGIVVAPEDQEVFDLLCNCSSSLIKTIPGTHIDVDVENETISVWQTTRITSFGLEKLKEHEIELGTYNPLRHLCASLKGKVRKTLTFV